MKKNPIFLNPQGTEQGIFHCQHLLDIILPRWFSFQSILHSCTPFSAHYLHFISSLCFPVASAAHVSSSTESICSRTFSYVPGMHFSVGQNLTFWKLQIFPIFLHHERISHAFFFQMKNICFFNKILANCVSTMKITVTGNLVILKWVIYEYMLPVFQQLLSMLSSERMEKKRLSLTQKL